MHCPWLWNFPLLSSFRTFARTFADPADRCHSPFFFFLFCWSCCHAPCVPSRQQQQALQTGRACEIMTCACICFSLPPSPPSSSIRHVTAGPAGRSGLVLKTAEMCDLTAASCSCHGASRTIEKQPHSVASTRTSAALDAGLCPAASAPSRPAPCVPAPGAAQRRRPSRAPSSPLRAAGSPAAFAALVVSSVARASAARPAHAGARGSTSGAGPAPLRAASAPPCLPCRRPAALFVDAPAG